MSDVAEPDAPAAPGATVGVTTRRGPVPTDDELAAILAAVEALWPRPAATAAPVESPRWRFSGRWWTKPVPSRRDRPF